MSFNMEEDDLIAIIESEDLKRFDQLTAILQDLKRETLSDHLLTSEQCKILSDFNTLKIKKPNDPELLKITVQLELVLETNRASKVEPIQQYINKINLFSDSIALLKECLIKLSLHKEKIANLIKVVETNRQYLDLLVSIVQDYENKITKLIDLEKIEQQDLANLKINIESLNDDAKLYEKDIDSIVEHREILCACIEKFKEAIENSIVADSYDKNILDTLKKAEEDLRLLDDLKERKKLELIDLKNKLITKESLLKILERSDGLINSKKLEIISNCLLYAKDKKKLMEQVLQSKVEALDQSNIESEVVKNSLVDHKARALVHASLFADFDLMFSSDALFKDCELNLILQQIKKISDKDKHEPSIIRMITTSLFSVFTAGSNNSESLNANNQIQTNIATAKPS